MPRLLEEEVTATYAGLRAATDHGDYLIEGDARQRYVLVGGIRSTGLTVGHGGRRDVSSPSCNRPAELGERRADLPAPPRMPNIGEAYLRPYQDAAAHRRRPRLRHASSASANASPPARSATPTPH